MGNQIPTLQGKILSSASRINSLIFVSKESLRFSYKTYSHSSSNLANSVFYYFPEV